MPIGVPLIVGGTLAVIGSGYAFKKFVYDPHLAPYIEAFIANQSHSHSQVQVSTSVPARSGARLNTPISNSTSRTSARPAIFNRLRRRRRDSAGQEETELLVSNDQEGHDAVTSNRGAAYELRDTQTLVNYHGDTVSRSGGDTDTTNDRGRHDDEIRAIIFNIPPPTPAESTFRTEPRLSEITTAPGSPSSNLMPPPGNSQHQSSPGRIQDQDPSTTFSFLSLPSSQVSSPDAPSSMLDSMSMSYSFSQVGTGMDELSMSMRETMSRSGYETETQSEGFSNISSPHRDHQELRSPPTRPQVETGGGGGGGLGLSTVGDIGMSYIPRPTVRRSGSVISLSESEGGSGSASASDWEAVSVPRSS